MILKVAVFISSIMVHYGMAIPFDDYLKAKSNITIERFDARRQ